MRMVDACGNGVVGRAAVVATAWSAASNPDIISSGPATRMGMRRTVPSWSGRTFTAPYFAAPARITGSGRFGTTRV